jgi:hypothetical protein
MWDLYGGRESRGIAIQATVGTLRDALEGHEDPRVFLGMVEYVYEIADPAPIADPLRHFFYKRSSFEHERELRAVMDCRQRRPIEQWRAPSVTGRAVPVDLESLIAAVHVSPMAPEWFVSLVARTTARLGLAIDVRQSNLYDGPVA